jgi:hypothetical protein
VPSNTARIGLEKHTTSDVFQVGDYADNWELLDDYPGVFICTSGTRPSTWGGGQAGMLIFETDTDLLWQWDGAAWQRYGPKGLLGRNTYTTGDLTTSSTTFVSVISQAVTIPSGGRSVMVVVDAPGAYNSNGVMEVAVYRGATPLKTWYHRGKLSAVASEFPEPINKTIFDTPASGAQTYSLQYRSDPTVVGSSVIQAGAQDPIEIAVVEV